MKKKNVVNLLFLGIDTNAARKAKMQGYRSDMLMVCAVDIDAKKATLISIPRDTYTTVYKVDENTGEVKETLQDKINSAYSYGGGATHYSYANAMACVQMFLERRCQLEQPLDFQLDIPVYLYAGIDMDGIPQVASAVGGVEVTLTESVPKVGSKGQTVTLKYQNAVEFLTNRHDTDGDTHRATRQQQFMIALAKKINNMGPADMILSLYDELQKYVWTNLNTDQMIDFAKILTKVNIDSIEMDMITGEGRKIDGSYCMLHDEAATLQLLLDVYYTKAS
jgi:anionic cell wall polymer biosynthesis LytR-Cps2A-Psr (LCP) family protein